MNKQAILQIAVLLLLVGLLVGAVVSVYIKDNYPASVSRIATPIAYVGEDSLVIEVRDFVNDTIYTDTIYWHNRQLSTIEEYNRNRKLPVKYSK